ncbi:putative amino acid racemase [uncultured Eubacteriales bacterium]|uniref:Putative amino acid racemase n=1 Tax=uncultured Eubacteriales bacterium TaxID=172733 RepID=A0A212KHI8_9FIRM|nr:putative amino acid racemase [uncultured Eubacteriales bacterium]
MFLQKTLTANRALIDFAFTAHARGNLLPNTYLLDLDALTANAAAMLAAADEHGVSLYFMLKQLGCNPEVARRLTDLGFSGAVAVDSREALQYKRAGIPLGNIGHLVQIPDGALGELLDTRPQIVTVYSLEKARKISALAGARGMVQDLMLRVVGRDDMLYSGQAAGFPLEELPQAAEVLKALPHVRVAGVCAFPCFLYDESAGDILPTSNTDTVRAAAGILQELGCPITQLNMPSATCARAIPKVAAAGGTHAEPGHGLTGTTPWNLGHAGETPALVYLSEISHNYGGKGYCYGGGHYRRGHMARALVGTSIDSAQELGVTPPDMDSIDYHFTLERPCAVGDAVVMAFRTQIFVTRSDLALVEGLVSGTPRVTALYDALGNRKG